MITRGIDRGAIRPSYLVHVHPHVANGAGAATKSSVVSGRVAVTGDQISVLLVLDDQVDSPQPVGGRPAFCLTGQLRRNIDLGAAVVREEEDLNGRADNGAEDVGQGGQSGEFGGEGLAAVYDGTGESSTEVTGGIEGDTADGKAEDNDGIRLRRGVSVH